ncbi:Type VI secretion system protein DotU (plasmid) [Caballeronia sp. SBC1]|uniref:DotU family type IV/VI secretion system protein n=1 Tax=unclassified Caballeronia TaxID=2646786 RepID=UPI0013E185EC|nr:MULTISPECIES: DotU/TssL family secretion system protein [unclassified Caballeronia]QIE27799.1 Type VI secretion system protein DotU [Caballeronia sp. SBC2]QIN65864.1 Type VI secretion system protein DotU [Caballeronia sp. SBC1]
MRALLRDTALEVSLLSQDTTEHSAFELRKRCLQVVDDFDRALQAKQFPHDVREDAVYAQCGLLDETALRCLPEDERSKWDAQPLQVERFGNHDAGERIYERIAVRVREMPPNVALLECYASVLGLGFLGRYAHDSEHKRTELVNLLNERILRARPQRGGFVIDTVSGSRLDWLRRLSPWTIAGIVSVTAALVWFVLGQSLDMQLANLPRLKP